MNKLTQIEGIGPKFAAMLKKAGLEHQDDLLHLCKTRRNCLKLAEQTGISIKLIMKWVHQADLARIQDINAEYAELLEEAGIDDVMELARSNPEQLYAALKGKKTTTQLHPPTLPQLTDWIEQAKSCRAVFTINRFGTIIE